MTNPKFMCWPHLNGEHNEHHMFLGHFKKKKSISGYIGSNCIEPKSLKERHDKLAKEMARRGKNHNSPLEVPDGLLDYLPPKERNTKIDRKEAKKLLLGRCKHCRELYRQWKEKKNEKSGKH